MSGKVTDNKRIAKNTVVLYLRMLLTLVLQLYTSRLVLQALGVEDYGIYNVVGGVVTMLNFFNMSLSNADARFIAIEVGAGKQNSIKKLFSCIMSIHYLFAAIILLFTETLGLWFVINKLVIPDGRMVSALWVYHGAVLSSVIAIISSPYNGLIIAHEKMSAFAVISIFDAAAKFLIALFLFVSPVDRLIIYSILNVLVLIIIRIVYMLYCRRKFEESKCKLIWDKPIYKQVVSFAGWTLTGNIAVMGYTQGLNILLNIFFGTVVNAARGISVQVQTAARMFCVGFQTAINPQILKSYAINDLQRMHRLIIMSSRFSYYLILVVSIPICLHTHYLLNLWLGNVPDYTVGFVQIMMAVGLLNTMQNPTMIALHATGNIKKVQIVESSMLLAVVPVAYVCLKWFHVSPVTVFVIYFTIEFITQFVRVFMIYPRIGLSRKDYFTKVLQFIVVVTAIAGSICYIVSKFIAVNTFCLLIIATICYVFITGSVIFLFGLTKDEQQYVFKIASKQITIIFQR